jgi:pimeloyl-ACP methyl ester carboxylesterase
MKPVGIILSIILLGLFTAPAAADWKADIDRLLETSPGAERERLIESIVSAGPEWQAVAAHIQAMEFPQVQSGNIHLDSTLCIDGVVRPWVLYVPPGYDPGVPTPLLVRLHRGVGRADVLDDAVGYAEDDEYLPVAEAQTWLVLYPFGQHGATWWDRVGMANIDDLVRKVKQTYNIDDDRVWMGGFSDGASGAFAHAMVYPSDYAAFVALNGHIGVGSLDGDLPLYAPNLANTPVYAVTTLDDELYPSARMRPAIEMARRAGGDILYRELEGTHDFDYAETELPRIAKFLERHRRDPFPHKIVWEAGEAKYGRCRWFKIERISLEDPEPWHTDYNAAMIDDRVTIGFVPGDSTEGVAVSTVAEETAAEEMGLEGGDVIILADDMAIRSMDDLIAFKATLNRGDEFSLTVRRGEDTILLDGQIPEAGQFNVFKRSVPSGLARVSFAANRIEIESSRIAAFSVLVHPDVVRLAENLVIIWNGMVVHDARVEASLEFMLRNFLLNRDRSLLYVAGLFVEGKAGN